MQSPGPRPKPAPVKRTDHYPKYEVVEHNGALAVAIPFHNEDKTRVWARLGTEVVRLSYNSKFFADLLDFPIDKMVLMRRQPTLWVLEKNDIGQTIQEYEVAIVALED